MVHERDACVQAAAPLGHGSMQQRTHAILTTTTRPRHALTDTTVGRGFLCITFSFFGHTFVHARHYVDGPVR
jgi:hypothetical protein